MGHGAHILIISFPAQGHINPTLQFAKRLIRLGAAVTFAATLFTQRQISKSSSTVAEGLTITTFSDGHDDGFKYKSADDIRRYMSDLKRKSSEKLRDIITTNADQGSPVTCLVYALLLPWASEVARSFDIPFALLWIQPATVLDIYYSYFNNYGDAIRETANNPSGYIDLPGLPRLSGHDLPSFFLPTSSPAHSPFLSLFEDQILALDNEKNPKVLVNTFDKLEPDALKAIEKYNMVGIGPLIPSAFLDQNDLSDRSFGADFFQQSMDCVEWLNSKPKSSVVYISFGSILELPQDQTEEIAYGLLKSERPFLWVLREKREENEEEDKYTISCIEELKQKGMIVPWCSQLEVLSHPSLGCFITHCGWNSTLESLASGMPVVAFPQWTDQATNAKLIEDIWNTGVRVRVRKETKMNDCKEIVDREEVKRCIEMVMADEEKSEELRRNARKWKDLAREAMMDGGTSDINLKEFLKEAGVAS